MFLQTHHDIQQGSPPTLTFHQRSKYIDPTQNFAKIFVYCVNEI